MIIVRWWKRFRYWREMEFRVRARFFIGQEVGELLGFEGKFGQDYAWMKVENEIRRLVAIDRGDMAPTKKTRGMIVNGRLIDRPEEER